MRLRDREARPGRALSGVAVLLVLSSLAPAARAAADGGSVSGVQEYLVPGTQQDMLRVFNRILADTYGAGRACVSTREGACVTAATAGGDAYVESRVSVVAYADRTVVLLDDDRNGFASGYDTRDYDDAYELDRGQVLTFGEDGRVERPGQPAAASRFALVGGDRIVTVGGPAVVMRAAWPKWVRLPRGTRSGVSVGHVLADTVTLYPTSAWGSLYGTPMGATTAPDPGRVDDRTTRAIVQAGEDGTVVVVDGVPRNAAPLARGQSLVLESVRAGAAIGGSSADGAGKPISVSLVTSGREPVEARFFNLTPQGLLDSSYVLPVNSMTDGARRTLEVRLYLYAYEPLRYSVYQGASSTPVAEGALGGNATAVHAIGAPTPLTRAASADRELSSDEAPALDGALRVVATGRLQVLAAMDSGSADYDWGFPGIGARHLANEYYVPWTPGSAMDRPGAALKRASRGGHPLFVSPAQDQTRIFADWDPWQNDGPETSVLLDAGQWAALVDPEDGDNTGARLYSLRAGGGPEECAAPLPDGVPEGAFAVAWGEGVLADRAADPDLGFGLPPQTETCQSIRLLKLQKLAEPEQVAPGGEFTITLTLTSDHAPIEAVSVADVLPNEDFEYVPGSARLFYPGSTTGVAVEPVTADGLRLAWDVEDPASPGEPYTLAPRSRLVVTFKVRVDEAGEYASPLPDTRPNNAEGYGKWCPCKGRPCYELKPTAFDNMRVAEVTGTIKVHKVVDWNETRAERDTVFRICVKPTAAGAERCQDVGWSGGFAEFRRVPAGEWTVYEKAVLRDGVDVTSEWVVVGSGQTVRVPGKCSCSSVEIKNRRKKVGKPSIVVHKVVDWSGVTPDPAQAFTLCVTGGPYAAPTVENGGCQVVGHEGGTLTWYDLPSGTYVVEESPHPGAQWTVWPRRLVFRVTGGRRNAREDLAACQNEGTIKNRLNPHALGSLAVTKVVDLAGGTADPTTFSICIQGPSYPTTPSCRTVGLEGGTLVWTNLVPGSYTVTEEDPGGAWSVEITGSPAEVTAGSNVTAGVAASSSAPGTCALKAPGQHDAWGGSSLPHVCPGHPWGKPQEECAAFGLEYEAKDDFDQRFASRDARLAIVKAGTCYTYFENVHRGDPMKTWDGKGISHVTYCGCPGPEPPPQAAVTVTNTLKMGASLTVTKVVDWNGVVPVTTQSFEVCIQGPSHPTGSCQVVGYEGGPVSWGSLVLGDYTVTETDPGPEWTVQAPPAPVPVSGLGALATVTNTRKLGALAVTKVAVWNGAPVDPNRTFTICITGPSFPGGDCRPVGPEGGLLTWTGLVPGSYAIAEQDPGPGWATTIEPTPATVPADGGTAQATVTNALLGSLAVTKVVNWSGVAPVPTESFEICIEGPSHPTGSCQVVGYQGGTLTFELLLPGAYTVTETNPGAEWAVQAPAEPVAVMAGGPPAGATVTNTYRPAQVRVFKNVEWNGYEVPATTFEICLYSVPDGTPVLVSCKTLGEFGGSLTWGSLAVGTYQVQETPPGPPWLVTQSPAGPFVVEPAGVQSVTVTNSYNLARLWVFKGVDWGIYEPVPSKTFEICIARVETPTAESCQTVGYRGGVLVWENLEPGLYTLRETSPGAGWEVVLPDLPLVLVAGDFPTVATVTNNYRPGPLMVESP